MKPFGNQLLPGTRRTLDEHRTLQPRGAPNGIEEPEHRRVLSHEPLLGALRLSTLDQTHRGAHLDRTFGRRG
jgi:hypothetical protein